MVIVAIPSSGNGGLKEFLNPRFGRCDCFSFVTIENGEIKEVKTVPNDAAGAMGGAGIQAAQIIGNNGASDIIVGFLGPNAFQSLSALNLKIYQAPNEQLTVKQAIDLYMQEKLQLVSGSTVGAHYGMGRGQGMGGGRGMGGGGGRGMGSGRRSQF